LTKTSHAQVKQAPKNQTATVQQLVQSRSGLSADDFDPTRSKHSSLAQQTTSNADDIADQADQFDSADDVANVAEGSEDNFPADYMKDDFHSEQPSSQHLMQKLNTDAQAYQVFMNRLKKHPEMLSQML